jgi:phospholipid/cholesterol/gamma-HCH transport system substrate-binding protein
MLKIKKVIYMKHNFIEAVLGAVVLLVAAYFLVFAYKANNSDLGDSYVIKAKFDRIDGLVVGGDVKISGVKVGTISTLLIDKQSFQAEVGISLSKDLKLPKDTTAEIVSESLLGGKYLALTPGISEENLPEGGYILRTQSSVNFESLISKFLFSKGDESKSEGQSSPSAK